MNKAAAWALGAAGLIVLAGCDLGGRPKTGAPVSPVLEAALQAIGGRETWQNVEEISTVAVVTVYDAGGTGHVNRQAQEIDLAAGQITATGQTPAGRWRASASLEGSGQVVGPLHGGDEGLQKLAISALAMTLHRAAGPLNFVFGPEEPGDPSPARIAGVDLIRIGVRAADRQAVAYYFHPDTKMLRFVTCGGDRAGAEGTVTEYTYMKLPNGMAFPESIRVVRIGENALIGPQRVLEVDFSRVSIR